MATKGRATKKAGGDQWWAALKALRGKFKDGPVPEETDAAESVRRATDGDTRAAMEILEAFAWSVESTWEKEWKGPMPYVTADYVAKALRRILEGGDPLRALGLKSSDAGRRRGTATHNSQALAALYYLLLRDGFTARMAESEINMETGASESTMRNAKREWAIYKVPERDRNELIHAARPLAKKWARIRERRAKRK